MSRWKKIINGADLNWLKISVKSFRGFLLLSTVVFLLGLCRPLYGQGTLAETATAVGLQEEIDGGGAQPAAPKPAARRRPDANAVSRRQGIERLEKIAQKLMHSMQNGSYDQSDFSEVWNAVVPKDTNFSDGINAILKPVFEQLGKAEKLGEGRVVGPNRAVFPVRFTRGTANMTVSLDQQDKIVEWTLTPSQPPSGPAAGEPSTKPAETIQGLPKDATAPEINDFNAFQRELNRMNVEARSEEEQWLGRLERKAELARAIDELVAAQLRFIRKLAVTEGADQTAKAIDLVLRQRQERLDKLETKLQEELKEERQQQPTERRDRRTPRPSDTLQDQPRAGERVTPPRRARATTPE
ncbi:MAG: DUF3887 domain-containing protein [Sedimentisphaerales bacterium]|nr:DUF3887 domain-containing protein [Sedimentisphaerales bacterium]